MKNRKLKKIYLVLTRKEKKKFSKWLTVELDTKDTILLKMYYSIQGKKSDHHIWKELFPNQPYNDQKFRKLSQQLTEYMEEFLAIKNFRRNGHLRDLLLVKELNRRTNPELFIKTLKKVKKRLNQNIRRDANYYRILYELEAENQQYLIKYPPNNHHRREQALNYAFDKWMMHEKLVLGIMNLNHYQLYGEKITTLLIEQVLELIKQNPNFNDLPALRIYSKLYDILLKETDEIEFIVKILTTNRNKLKEDTIQNVFYTIFNYFIRRANKTSETIYLEKLLDFYNWGINKKIIFINNKLPINHYKNIITLGLHLKAYETVRNYLRELKSFLPAEDREEAYTFNLAHYYFSKKEFQKSKQLLLNKKFSKLFYEIDGRIIFLKSRYELEEREDLISPIQSLISFIRYQKSLGEQNKKLYQNFLNLFKKLARTSKVLEVQKLRRLILETKPLNSQAWLLEKIKEFS